jgi:tetraacyldisaccharide 4'-kinase
MNIKKPKFWDFKKPNLISYLLIPFTIPLLINNFFLNKKNKKIKEIKSICVGNIYIGGTGKTPSTIKLYEILRKIEPQICTGKKFYSNHEDEKIILEKKTNLISEDNREKIIQIAIKKKQKIIIFDDGLQDKKLDFDLKFVCFEAENWIGNGKLIPAGPLREKISSLKKYDAVFLKDSELNNNVQEIIKNYNQNIEVFHTSYQIKNFRNFDLSKKFLVFSGIGNPKNFMNILNKNNFKIIDQIIFSDHYNYKQEDINFIKNRAKKINAEIITTEKDFVKISKFDNENINFLEIELKIENEKKLINFIKNKIL